MKYDKPLLAILFGLVSAILFEGYMQIIKGIHLSPVSLFEANSLLFVAEPNWWIGALTTPMTGGLAGLIIYFSTLACSGVSPINPALSSWIFT